MADGARGGRDDGLAPAVATRAGRPATVRTMEHWPRLLVHAGALAPAVWLAVEVARGDAADPVRALILRSGAVGLALLIAALACTPLAVVSGWRQAVQVRRALGLYGFAYIAVHLAAYTVFDGWLDPALIWRDLGERRSMLVGMVSFLLLIPLAATSTAGWQRRLGRRWKLLHRLVYLAAPLAVLHYLWLERDVVDGPVLAAAAVGVLLALRLPPVRRAVTRARQRLAGRAA
jgi:sulfoxide reductase heme-binding subunit YedZ